MDHLKFIVLKQKEESIRTSTEYLSGFALYHIDCTYAVKALLFLRLF